MGLRTPGTSNQHTSLFCMSRHVDLEFRVTNALCALCAHREFSDGSDLDILELPSVSDMTRCPAEDCACAAAVSTFGRRKVGGPLAFFPLAATSAAAAGCGYRLMPTAHHTASECSLTQSLVSHI